MFVATSCDLLGVTVVHTKFTGRSDLLEEISAIKSSLQRILFNVKVCIFFNGTYVILEPRGFHAVLVFRIDALVIFLPNMVMLRLIRYFTFCQQAHKLRQHVFFGYMIG